MENKGFAEITNNIDTPNDVRGTEKPLTNSKTQTNRVDINILKSKLQESEDKEFKKNMAILFILVLGLSMIGISLSL
tara:strand:+ start:192 stop:422 length:231 start_codon:yes stop_codon:yes gene_type:complete